MLTRMVDPSLRVTPDWELGESSWSAQGATLGDLVPLGSYIPDPASAEELDESIRYMLSNNTNVLELCYDNITVSAAQDVMEAALAGVKTYCEQCYNTVNCTYSTNGTLTLTFSAADAGGPHPHLPGRGHGCGHRRPRSAVGERRSQRLHERL